MRCCCRVVLFLVSLCLLAAFAPWAGEAAPSPEQSYQAAKARLNTLDTNPKRAKLRDNWLRIAAEFDRLYARNPNSNLRPAMLFQAARSYDELSRRSYNRKDAGEAISRYEKLAADHPQSNFADDALLAAAKLHTECLDDNAAARGTLARLLERFPKSDSAAQAGPLLKRLPSAKASPDKAVAALGANAVRQPKDIATSARLNKITWAPRKYSAGITVSLSAPVAWAVYSQPASPKTGQAARLIIELPGASPVKALPPGAKINRGILKRMRINLTNSGVTQVILDFSSFRKFTVKDNGDTLILNVTDAKGALQRGKSIGESVGSSRRSRPVPMRAPSDLARQLGLTVRTIILDPGHGGNDAGTAHNDIIEKTLTLDMVKRIGAQLRRLGYDVRFTRDKDVRLPLNDRVTLANNVKADLFLSIHVNANPKDAVSGFETYYLNFASSRASARVAAVENAMGDRNLGELQGILADFVLSARTQESRKLASSIQKKTLSSLKHQRYNVRDGGVRSAPFIVLMGSGMPGVLVELGYCTNRDEAKNLKRDDYRNALAKGIAEGVKAYADALTAR